MARLSGTKAGALFWLLVVIPFLSPIVVQTAQSADLAQLPTQKRAPAKTALIVSFNVSKEGALHIIYSDGAEVEIPKERGRFAIGEQILTQETFSDIQMADDHQHIGWLADYMICAQSYPCTADLGIYQFGYKLRYFRPEYGIFWRWKFLKAGKQIVVQYGFPHGEDTSSYALYDTETGHEIAKFYSKNNKAPNWVQQLRGIDNLQP
jgi:hypothetical protein